MSLEELGNRILSERIKRSPLELAKAYNPGYLVNWHHEIIVDVTLNHKKTCLILPPGSGKTTLGIATICWRIGQNPINESYLVVSYNDVYARGILAGCAKIISSYKPYILAFGKLKPLKPDKWAHNQLVVEGKHDIKTPSIEAIGIRSGTVGRHPMHVLLDDPLDRTIAESKSMLRDAKRWFHSELMTRLDPESTVSVILTRWRFNDLAADLIKDPSWEKIVIEAIGNKGSFADRYKNQSYWPERWPLKELRERMKDPYTWSTQYMCDPSAGGEASPLKEEWLNYWTKGEPDPDRRLYQISSMTGMKIIGAVDPAIGVESQNDYFVMLTLGVNEYGNMFVLSYIRDRIDPAKQIEIIQEEFKNWKHQRIIVESNAAQYYLARGAMSKILPIEPKRNLSDKVGRIVGTLAVYFKNGTLRILPEHVDLIEEYKQFPYGDNDDILDSLEMAVSSLRDEVSIDWSKIGSFGGFSRQKRDTYMPRG